MKYIYLNKKKQPKLDINANNSNNIVLFSCSMN